MVLRPIAVAVLVRHTGNADSLLVNADERRVGVHREVVCVKVASGMILSEPVLGLVQEFHFVPPSFHDRQHLHCLPTGRKTGAAGCPGAQNQHKL